jgi:leader peptidase (prepilin peptidase)/N-methyltransferase
MKQSVVTPRSACRHCGQPIRWFDNIPLLSWVLLRARCRHCGAKISTHYLIVELVGALLAIACWHTWGFTWPALTHYAFVCCLLVAAMIDLKHRIIPDRITLPGIPIAFAVAVGLDITPWPDALLGIVSGGGGLLLVAAAYTLITGRSGMGGGDIKLLAMIGAYTGWQGVLFTILAASLAGSVVGLIVMLIKSGSLKTQIPFGPFLSAASAAFLFWGDTVIRWYTAGFG